MVLLMAEIWHQLRLVVYPIISRSFFASQVVVWDVFHQQYPWIDTLKNQPHIHYMKGAFKSKQLVTMAHLPSFPRRFICIVGHGFLQSAVNSMGMLNIKTVEKLSISCMLLFLDRLVYINHVVDDSYIGCLAHTTQ